MDTDFWPALRFGPINLWSLPAAWKTQAPVSAIDAHGEPARRESRPAMVDPRVVALCQHR